MMHVTTLICMLVGIHFYLILCIYRMHVVVTAKKMPCASCNNRPLLFCGDHNINHFLSKEVDLMWLCQFLPEISHLGYVINHYEFRRCT